MKKLCLPAAQSFLHNDCMATSQWNTNKEDAFPEMKDGTFFRELLQGTSSGNFFKSRSFFDCFRTSTTNRKDCCRRLLLKQVDNYCYFLMPTSVCWVCILFCAKILFPKASIVSGKLLAKKVIAICLCLCNCHRLLKQSVTVKIVFLLKSKTVSLTVTTKSFEGLSFTTCFTRSVFCYR